MFQYGKLSVFYTQLNVFIMCQCQYVLHLFFAKIRHIGFWPRNVVCYENVCLSVCHTRELRLSSSRYRNMLYTIP